MQRIVLNDNNKIELDTTLTKGQIAKFNSLLSELVFKNGAAYLSIKHLHGALLTRSKDMAKSIVQAYRDILRTYLVTADELGVQSEHDFIRPIGVQILLDHLATDRPRRATDYRASAALLAYIIAAHPQLAMIASQEDKNLASFKAGVIRRLKSKHQVCQLTGQAFGPEHEKHVHHIVAEAVDPRLAADEDNLIVITGGVHDEYHAWINTIPGAEISRPTLRNFARQKGYSLDWDKSATVGVA
ncbi:MULTISPECIES: hypothetical protein [Cyanophyceae]|uniref:HNH endonuclease n=1 Tax=Leptolyngbya subtilissima DQ-A4 TaxID=2933933 RepID=A0ABV0KC08_9CYAN|nr:hypothetical protein [Nodosilinea sp. FACHB-141]MBD2111718.1 hypothetical protein [Nodosilinea sp. FACHB-141]